MLPSFFYLPAAGALMRGPLTLGARSFIPLSLLVFALLVAAMWAYLVGVDGGGTSPKSRAPTPLLPELFAAFDGPASGADDAAPAGSSLPARVSLPPPLSAEDINTAPRRPAAPAVDDTSSLAMAAATPGQAEPVVEPPADPQPAAHPLGWTLARLRDWADRADDAALRRRSNAAGDPDVLLRRGHALSAKDRHDDALRVYERALLRQPEDATLRMGRAQSLAALGRIHEACEAFQELCRDHPGDASMHYNLGVALYRLSRYDEARAAFAAALRIDPDHAEAHFNLATLAQRDGRLAEARDAWLEYTYRRPQNAAGWFHLGVVWMDLEDPARAADCFSRAIACDGADADAHLNLALAHLALDEPDGALLAAQQADVLLPCDRIILLTLSEIHAILADRGAADGASHRAALAELIARIDALDHDAAHP